MNPAEKDLIAELRRQTGAQKTTQERILDELKELNDIKARGAFGIGGCVRMSLVFFVLKVTGFLDWSFWFVWLPVYATLPLAAISSNARNTRVKQMRNEDTGP